MPPRLVLEFLGLPQVHLDDQPIATDRRKAIALLAYLAVSDRGRSPQNYSRESLSALFWPDYEQSKAFSNLRRTIWEVNQVLGGGWLIAERESIRLNEDAQIDLDVARFLHSIARTRQQEDIALRISLLADSVKLYRNHFLTGFSLKDAPNFNEWAFAESEDLRRQLAEALAMLSEDLCTLGQADQAIPYARRLVTLDPLNESAHRQLIEVYLQAGQHSAALKQYQACEQILRKELNLDPQPETRALYKRIRKGEIEPARVKKQIETSAPQHNLPAQISTFIGREKEQEEIVHLLTKHRLVTLVGMGGIGKTRIVLEVGNRVLHDFPSGVWFIALDSLSDPELVPQTVAAIFDLREGSERPVIEVLISVLREKTTLLILDNCEHLVHACTQLITRLLTNCPNLRVLATSRQTLKIRGEAVYFLPSMSIPEASVLTMEKLTEYESIQLFTERAALALSSFTLTNENAKTVADICYRLDGIPLAIELAAARINLLQVKEIQKQLEDSFSLLTSDSDSTVQRHRTLHASMDWSWGLLTESEQSFLRQLSVFAGGWTLESAQIVCDGDALQLMSALVKKSLIIVNRESGSETRYRFHEFVRQYARERLVETGEEEIIRTRHLKYFLQFTESAEPALRGPAQMEWYARLDHERDNIRAALEWADKTDVEAGLYLSSRLERFWESFDLREGASWYSKFLQKPESHAFPKARAKALYAYVQAMVGLQQFEAAHSAAEECLRIYRSCGDQQGEVDGLLMLGWESTNAAKKKVVGQQAFELAQSLGDVRRQAMALWNLGWSDHTADRFVYWKKAIALHRSLGDLQALAGALSSLGYFHVMDGKIESALPYLDEASKLYQQLNLRLLSSTLLAYGQIALARGDFERARAYIQENARNGHERGNQQDYLWSRAHLGYVALREGSINESRQIFMETARDFQKDGYEIGVIFTLEGMAELYVSVGKPEHAARLIGWAEAARGKLGDTRPLLEQANVDKIIAASLAKMGEVEFSDAYEEGQGMTLDEAVMYALTEAG
jgi:predicted ATPase/DNA-binding SARP family transcriptional activator